MTCRKILWHCGKFSLLSYNHFFVTVLNRNSKIYFNQIQTTRTLSTGFLQCNKNQISSDITQNTFDINEFKRINFTGTKYVYITLTKIFNISINEAKAIIKLYPKFRKCSSELIDSNYKLYQSEGISNDIIKKCPVILALKDAENRLKYIKELSLDINKTAPLLAANMKDLRKMITHAYEERKQVPYGSRIILISKLLNVPEWQISEKLARHTYITRIPIERLEKNLKILLEYGVDSQNILNDFWVLRYSPEIAENRLKAAINANVSKVKAWMVRCTNSVFERCINRQVENRKILGSYTSVEEYLSKRLECTIENAKYLTEKYPAIEKMNTSKMKEMMDYLFEQGYTPGHICRVPRILVHSLETTKSRMTQLKRYGFFPPSLAILCKSKRDYDKYLKKYFKKEIETESETKQT